MGSFSIWHWVIVLVIVLVLFGGRGKISGLMGDFGKGLKSFKKNMKDETSDTESDSDDSKQIPSAAKEADVPSKEKAAKS